MGNAGRYSRKNGHRDSLRSDSEGGIPALGWASMSGIIAATLFLEYVMSSILFFSPGWANGWPFGVRFQSVLSAAATGWISIMLMTLAAGVGCPSDSFRPRWNSARRMAGEPTDSGFGWRWS